MSHEIVFNFQYLDYKNEDVTATRSSVIEILKDNFPPAYREDYTFRGWWTSPLGSSILGERVDSEDYTPTDSTTLYARWEPTTYQSRDVDPKAQAEENKLVRTSLTKLPEPFISGLKLRGDIAIYNTATQEELTLNAIDDNDVVWVVSNIEGWWTLPENELPDLPRGWGDGSYDAIGRYSNRIITLDGSFLPQRPEDAYAARAKLIDFLSPLVKTQGAGYLIVDEPGPTGVIRKSAKVRLSGVPIISSTLARGRHDFSIGLKAVDPIKYEFVSVGETPDPDGYDTKLITSGTSWSGVVVNKGNIPVPVIFEVASLTSIPNASNPPTITLAETEEEIIILGTTSATTRLEIDTYNREILAVDYLVTTPAISNARSKASVLVDWIYLQPGNNTIELTGFPAGATCTVYFKSGWIG